MSDDRIELTVVESSGAKLREPYVVIMEGLTAQARGEDVDYDAMDEACTLVAAANLVAAGLSVDAVEELFMGDRGYSFKVAYERSTDELTVDVVWEDEPPAAAVPAGGPEGTP